MEIYYMERKDPAWMAAMGEEEYDFQDENAELRAKLDDAWERFAETSDKLLIEEAKHPMSTKAYNLRKKIRRLEKKAMRLEAMLKRLEEEEQ